MPERGIVYFRMTGVLHTSESVSAFVDYTRDPCFDTSLTMLSNAEGLRGLKTNFAEVVRGAGEIKELMEIFSEPVLSVIYCTSNTSYGMARVMQQVIEPMSKFRFKITKNPIEALKFAGQPDLDFGMLDSALSLKAAG